MPFFKNHYIISMKIYGVERRGTWNEQNLIKLYVFALVLLLRGSFTCRVTGGTADNVSAIWRSTTRKLSLVDIKNIYKVNDFNL